MADPIFPSLAVVKEREFQPQRWGLDFVLQTAVKQAESEEEARRQALAIKAKELEAKRTNLLREATRLESQAGQETGRVLRTEQAIDQDILDQWARAQNEAERANVQAAFRARTGNRDADLRAAIANMQQQEINRRQSVGGSTRRPPALSTDAGTLIADVTTRVAADPGAGGAELYGALLEAKRRTNYSSGSDRERAYETKAVLDEYARKVADRERRAGNNITADAVAAQVLNSGTVPSWVLQDLRTVVQDQTQAPARTPTTMNVPREPVAAGRAFAGSVDPVMGDRAAPVDTSYIDQLRARAQELAAQVESLEELELTPPVPILRRAQEIARGQFGPEAARARIELRANREANSLLTTQYTAKNLVGFDVPADDRRVAQLAWDKVEEDPIYQTVKNAVGLGSKLTSWERLRSALESRYARNPAKMQRALAYYKMLRYMKDNRLL